MISFTVPLTAQDWDETRFGWRLPVLKIPDAKVEGLYDGGKVSDDWFEVDAPNELVKWQHGPPPKQAAICVMVPDNLTTFDQAAKQADEKATRQSQFWKNFAVVVPVLVAAISASAGWKIGGDKAAKETQVASGPPPPAPTCETWTVMGKANLDQARLKPDNLLAVMQPPELNFDSAGNFVWYIPVPLSAGGRPVFPKIMMAVQGAPVPAPPAIYLGFPNVTPQDVNATDRRITLRDITFATPPPAPYAPGPVAGTN